MKRILTTLCLLAALRASASDPWWIEDVWSKPDRPFLYYGEGNPAETKKPEEAPVREAEPEPDPEPEIITIADALKSPDGTADLSVKGVVTLLDGQNVYLQDSTGGICVRMSATAR